MPEGQPESVRYDQINAMLLNEFLKEHRKNEKREATDCNVASNRKAGTTARSKLKRSLRVRKQESLTG